MKKLTKKIVKLKKILLVLVLGIVGIGTSIKIAKATTSFESPLILKEDIPLLLMSSEIDVEIKHVYHKYDNKEYPAYCLNEFSEGVSKDNQYTVTVDSEITDEGLCKIIKNGYPYKSIEELGCETEQEAYTATQSAIYYYLADSRGLGDYSYVEGENEVASMRTLEAMKNIITNAENSNEEVPGKIYYGKAPDGGLQNYALTGIEEKQETSEITTEKVVEETPAVVESAKLPVTGM